MGSLVDRVEKQGPWGFCQLADSLVDT